MTASASPCPSVADLRLMLVGELDSARTDELATHLASCADCQQRAEEIDAANDSEDRFEFEDDAIPFAEESQCRRLVEELARMSPASKHPRDAVSAGVGAPESLGDFELISRLGEGGMGTVYRARHRTMGTEAAVKILHPQRQIDEATIERFEREMVALGRLDHPNIVRALDAGYDDGQHYLVMEYVDGTDLGQVLRGTGPLPIAEAAEVVRQAALGLAYVHENGRVHRDVKPSNLMLSSDGTVKLLDLGLARVEEYPIDEPLGGTDDILGGSTLELTRTHQVMGTLDYMAPEQASDSRSVDHRADIYALGCTLYKLLTGHSPFASSKSISALSQVLAHVETPAPPVTRDRADVPEGLSLLLSRMLEKKPEDRPQTAGEVAEALKPFAVWADLSKLATQAGSAGDQTTQHAASPTIIGDSGQRVELSRTDVDLAPSDAGRRRWKPVATIALFLLLAAAGVWAAFWSPLAAEPTATLLVEVASPEVAAELSRSQVTISGGEHVRTIREGRNEVPVGRYLISVKKDSRLQFSQRDFHLNPDEQIVLAVSLAPVQSVVRDDSVSERGQDARSPASNAIDLIPLIDPQRDIRGDDWRVEGSALVSHADQPSMVLIPYRPPDEYRLELTATRLTSSESLQLGLAVGNQPLILAIDAHPADGHLSGLYQVNGQGLPARSDQAYRGQVLPMGRPVQLTATVRRNGNRASVDLFADNRAITSWRGPISTASATGSFPPPELGVLFLGNWTAEIRVKDLRITPLNGEGEIVRFSDPQVNPVRAAMERAVWKGGEVTVDVGGDRRLIQQLAEVSDLPSVSAPTTNSNLGSFLERMADTESQPQGTRLIGIDMQQSRWLNDDDLRFFANLPHLQTLNLQGTSVTQAGLDRLGKLPALTSLSLASTGVRGLSESLGVQMPSLRHLDLHLSPLQSVPGSLLEQLPSLEVLNLSQTPVRDDIAKLSSAENLRTLDLSNTRISDTELNALPAAHRLNTLNLAGTRVSHLETVTPDRFPELTHLNVLDAALSAEQVARCEEAYSSSQRDTAAESRPTVTSEPVDLIELIDVERDADSHWNPDHRWSKQDGQLISSAMSRVAIPVELPSEFDLAMRVTRLEAGEAPILAFVLPDRTRLAVGFDYSPANDDRKFTLLHGVAGQKYLKSPAIQEMETFPLGESVDVEVQVRRAGDSVTVRVLKESDEVLFWEGELSQLAPYGDWWLGPRSDRPWMSQWNGRVAIDELTLIPVAGDVVLPSTVSQPEFEIVSSYGPIDLIGMFDPERDKGNGRWSNQAGVLQAPSHTRVLLPVYLPPEFEIEMKVRKTKWDRNGGNAPLLQLPLPDGTRVMVGFDHWPEEGGYTIIHGLDGKMERESPVKKPGMVLAKDAVEPTRLMVRVEGADSTIRVAAYADGDELIAWEGDRSRLQPHFYGNPHDPQRPTIAQNGGATEISELTLTPLSGRVELPSFGPSYADPDRDVAEWVLAHGGTFKIPLVRGQNWNRQRYVPGDELPDRPFRVAEINNLTDQLLPKEWLAEVGRMKELQTLIIQRTQFDNVDLAPLANLTSLTRFGAARSSLNDEGLAYIASLPNLSNLTIGLSDVTPAGIEVLRNHPALVNLGIGLNDYDPMILSVAATMPKLTSLTLFEMPVTGEGLKHLRSMDQLEALYIANASHLDADDLRHLLEVHSLQTLKAVSGRLGEDAAKVLGQLAGLRSLDIWRNPIGDEGVAHLADLRNLIQLRIGATGITDKAFESISHLRQLEILALESNPKVTDAAVIPITKLRRLRELHIVGTSMTPDGIAQLQAALPNCLIHTSASGGTDRTLDLRGSDIGDEELAGVLEGEYPTTLIIQGPGITDASIPTILSRPALKRLALYGTRITESGVGELAALANLQRIEFWNMRQISGDVTSQLLEFPGLEHVVFKTTGVYGPGLQRLQGSGIQGINIGHEAFNGDMLRQFILPFGELRVLDLAGSHIHDEDIALLKEMTITGTLHLGYNANITGSGLAHVRALLDLKYLNLDASAIDSSSLKHLEGLENLRKLWLRQTAVGDDAIESLATLVGLEQLDVTGTQLTSTGIARLQAALPGCNVLADVEAAVGGKFEFSDSEVSEDQLPALLAGQSVGTLVLQGPGFTDASIPAIVKLSGLVKIVLRNTRITEDGIRQLTSLQSLEEVAFWNMPQISGDVTQHLAQLPNLHVVIFKDTGIYGPGLERLHGHDLRKVAIGHPSVDREMLETYIVPFGPIRDLDVAGTRIDDDDVALLKSMDPYWLHLGYNPNISGPGLAELKEMPSLRILLLDSAPLEDEGFTHLAGADQIERLYLRNVPITDSAIETLLTLTSLQVLDITGSNISDEGIERIRQLMPQVRLWTESLEGEDATYPPQNAQRVVENGWRPAFSADGTQLVYGLPQGQGLQVLHLESGEVRLLHEIGKDAKWSPDGEWIAFIREQRHNSGNGVLALIRPDGTDLQTFDRATYPFWYAAGKKLGYYSPQAKGLMKFDVADPQTITTFHEATPSYFCAATSDGRYLAYGSEGTLNVIERESGDVVFSRSFADSTGTGLPAFSPDDRYLAYNAWGTPEAGIWIFDWQDGHEVALFPGDFSAPSWAPDGGRLAFDYIGQGRHEVWVADVVDRLPGAGQE